METYNPDKVTVIVDGMFLTGYADGTFVNCEKEEENYEVYVGAQGEVSRAKKNHSIGTIAVTLKQTSPSHALLSRLAKTERVFPAYVIDRNTQGAIIGGSQAWIEKDADYERGPEIAEQEWTIVVGNYKQHLK